MGRYRAAESRRLRDHRRGFGRADAMRAFSRPCVRRFWLLANEHGWGAARINAELDASLCRQSPLPDFHRYQRILSKVGELRSIATYAALRRHLPPHAFELARSRLLWLPAHAAIITALAWAIVERVPLWPIASLFIGVSIAMIACPGREILHGAVVRGASRFACWAGCVRCRSPSHDAVDELAQPRPSPSTRSTARMRTSALVDPRTGESSPTIRV